MHRLADAMHTAGRTYRHTELRNSELVKCDLVVRTVGIMRTEKCELLPVGKQLYTSQITTVFLSVKSQVSQACSNGLLCQTCTMPHADYRGHHVSWLDGSVT